MPTPNISYTDVAIIGAGPSGLMAAMWFAKCGISTRIIDRRSTKVFKGQADSLQVRTMEIFDSFGITSTEDGGIYPTATIPEYYPSLSRFHQVLINQGRIERTFLNAIESIGGIEVERGVIPTDIEINDSKLNDPQSYAVKLTVHHLSKEELSNFPWAVPVPGKDDFNVSPGDEIEIQREPSRDVGIEEIVHAKYVIGCDGARSWTRKATGLKFEGLGNDPLWGAMDIIPATDFPDIRVRAIINSPRGSMMIVPRENGLIRLGVKLDTLDRSQVSPAAILATAQKIISPYKLEYTYCDWHAVYQSNQRLANHFAVKNRVFLAGDAVHTHSPKAGIGMNFSIQDTYNLGWKLAHVVKGIAKPSILSTYEQERGDTAKKLVNFDKEFTLKLSGGNDTSIEQIQQAFYDALPFTSCTSIEYSGSSIIAKEGSNFASKPELAQGLTVGQRLPSKQVVDQSNGRPLEFQERFPSDGKYRIVVFAGDISIPEQQRRLQILAETLDAPNSSVQKMLLKFGPDKTPIEVLLLHCAKRQTVMLTKLHPIFYPMVPPRGQAYDRVYVDELPYTSQIGKAYEGYGVDKQRGCLVTVRPDGHVMHIGELEDVLDLEEMFNEILL